MSSDFVSVGDIVKARPRLTAPRSPSSLRQVSWPYFVPARCVALAGDDGVVVDFLPYQTSEDQPNIVGPWQNPQAFSRREVHRVECRCHDCSPGEALSWNEISIPAPDVAEGTEAREIAGTVLFLPARDFLRGDFVCFPLRHLHQVELRGDRVHLNSCSGGLSLDRGEVRVVYRPCRAKAVCNRDSADFDPAFTPHGTEVSLVERVVITRLSQANTLPESATPETS